MRKLPAEIKPPTISARSSWIKKTFKLLTPLYCGGAEKDKTDPFKIRASVVRGHLKHWWRLVIFDKTNLKQREEALWGSSVNAGKVKIKVVVNKTNDENSSVFDPKLVKYLTFGITINQSEYLGVCTFQLWIDLNKCDVAQKSEVQNALIAFANLGGLGIRTRRGFGALFCEELSEDAHKLAWKDETELSRFLCVSSSVNPTSWKDVVIIRHVSALRESETFSSIKQAWKLGVKRLQEFRQGQNFARTSSGGKSYWPEAQCIRELVYQQHNATINGAQSAFNQVIVGANKHDRTESLNDETTKALYDNLGIKFNPDKKLSRPESPVLSFPRAAFGLPITFLIRNENRVNQIEDISPTLKFSEKSDRLASPIILRPIQFADGSFAVVFIRLNTPDLTSAVLEPHTKDAVNTDLKESVKLRQSDVSGIVAAKVHRAISIVNRPMQYTDGDDVLDAFMNYLRGCKPEAQINAGEP